MRILWCMENMKKRLKRHMIWWITGGVAVCALLAAALWPCLHTVRYTLKSGAIDTPLRIAAISDLHSQPLPFEDLADAIRKEQPDILFLVGDIIDDHAPIEGAIDFLEGIRGICPTYYVTGNHEYRSGKVGEFCTLLENYGINVLSDQACSVTVAGNRLVLAGLEDPERRIYEDLGYDQQQVMVDAFGGLSELPGYRILLAHRPERIAQYMEYPFDLVLSGHAHGGQIRIPLLLNGLFAPNQGLFPKYAGGLYSHGACTHIVCRGISHYGYPIPRVFNPPELAVIDLTPD